MPYQGPIPLTVVGAASSLSGAIVSWAVVVTAADLMRGIQYIDDVDSPITVDVVTQVSAEHISCY